MRVHHLAPDLVLIDTGYQGTPDAIAVYLLLGERPALIETGPASVAEAVLAGVRAAGVDPQDLRAAAVTHIHLDHAGGAGTLADRLPRLQVYVHPVGAPHLADPARLLASAGRLYGDALQSLFGRTIPVPPDRLHILEDNDAVLLGGRRLRALHTPGHASHHHVYFDDASGDLFTGDVAGVVKPRSRYVAPPTPPPDLDFTAWRKTIQRLRDLRPERLLLTHFGPHTDSDDLLVQLWARLDAREHLAHEIAAAGWDAAQVAARLQATVAQEMAEIGGAGQPAGMEVMMPMHNNVTGLLRYAQKLGGRAGVPPA